MKRNLGWLLAATLVPSMSVAVDECRDASRSAPDPALVEQLEKLEHDRIQAGVRKDVAFIDAATAEEYVQIDWNGRILDKAATLGRIGGSGIRLQSNTVDDIDVKIYGNTAIVTSTSTRKGVMDGKDVSGTIRGTKIYVMRDGRWQVVHFQQTLVAPQA
jgi:hypothetical protein